MSPKIVLCDLDGTLVPDIGGYTQTTRLQVSQDTILAAGRLRRAGFLLWVVTNQSKVAAAGELRNDMLKLVQTIHQDVRSQLTRNGVNIHRWFICPHAPNSCDCRKPAIGHFKDWHKYDSSGSWVVGDKLTDMQLAANLTCQGVLLRSKYWSFADTFPRAVKQTVADFPAAVSFILGSV